MRPQAIGGSTSRVGEYLSRDGPSAKTALTGHAQGRERLYKTSLPGSARRKVAARATRKCPDSRALSSHEAAGYRRLGKWHKRIAVADRYIDKAGTHRQQQGRERLHRASLTDSARRKVAARATRKCPDSRSLSSHKAANHRRLGRSQRRATVAGRSIGEAGTHRPGTAS
jgi:hypothetical protein